MDYRQYEESDPESEYDSNDEEEDTEYENGYAGYSGGDPSSHNENPGHTSPKYPPPMDEEYEDEDEEEVEQLTDALELNKQLKEIMSSGQEPMEMQRQLQAIMGQMSMAEPVSQAQAPAQRARMGKSVAGSRAQQPEKRAPLKNSNAGKTFSSQQTMSMAKDNQRLLKNMIKIQTTKESTIGGYSTRVSKGSAIVGLKSSNAINRNRKVKKQADENRKFLTRLQNVKGTLDTKKMRKDADRNEKIGAMRRNVGGGGGAGMRGGSQNVYGKNADSMRMSKFRAPPSLKQPDWEC